MQSVRRDRGPAATQDFRRCRVEATARGEGWSYRLGPGAIVDLNALVAPGVRVRDVVDVEWFDAPASEVAERESA